MKTRDSVHHPTYRIPTHSKVKGIYKPRRNKGDMIKLGSSEKQTEIESNRRQIPILRKYIKQLREKGTQKDLELARQRFREFLISH